MIPILYSKDTTQFNNNGIGMLADAISCKVTEELNGMFELEMIYPIEGIWYSSIEMNSIIRVIPNVMTSTLQPFRVYKISRPLNGRVTINAQHITYQMNYIPIMPIAKESRTAGQALTAIAVANAESCPFSLSTNMTNTAEFELKTPESMRSVIGGVEGSFLDVYGGEITWGYPQVTINTRRGSDSSMIIQYGKNLTELLEETTVAGLVTGICPYARYTTTETVDDETVSNEVVVTLTERVIESQYASNYPFNRTACVDLTDKIENEAGDPITEEQLRTAANQFITDNLVGVPKVTLQVSFVGTKNDSYIQTDSTNDVALGDTVKVHYIALNIDTTERVRRVVYDVLKDRNDSAVIGKLQDDLAETIYNLQIGTETGM